MKILVDEMPVTCSQCLFLNQVRKYDLIKENRDTTTGCTLTNIPISMEIGTRCRLNDCPLKQI